MNSSVLSRHPRLSWLGFHVEGCAGHGPISFAVRLVAHVISVGTTGRFAVRWISRRHERQWVTGTGRVTFLPADHGQHVFQNTAVSDAYGFSILLIPPAHLECLLRSEGCAANLDPTRLIDCDDWALSACMCQLTSPVRVDDGRDDESKDEAARRLVLRLVELTGGGRPDWHDDHGGFAGRTLADLIDYIDAHLHVAPSLSDMALRLGLSPSHFGRKFRTSTGMSLHRFINMRRVARSLQVLQDASQSLAGVGLGLGFSSQSHFTRVFGEHTGMTPAKYRRQFRATVG